MKNHFYKTCFIITISILLPIFLFAQAPGFDNDTADVPIDGGISILIAFGIGYGIKKNLNREKQKKPADNCRLP